MNWTEWITYLTHPQADMTLWVCIAIPVIFIVLNFLLPRVLAWRDYRRKNPLPSPAFRASAASGAKPAQPQRRKRRKR